MWLIKGNKMNSLLFKTLKPSKAGEWSLAFARVVPPAAQIQIMSDTIYSQITGRDRQETPNPRKDLEGFWDEVVNDGIWEWRDLADSNYVMIARREGARRPTYRQLDAREVGIVKQSADTPVKKMRYTWYLWFGAGHFQVSNHAELRILGDPPFFGMFMGELAGRFIKAPRTFKVGVKSLTAFRAQLAASQYGDMVVREWVKIFSPAVAKKQAVVARRRALEARQLAPGGRIAREAARRFGARAVKQLCQDLQDNSTLPQLRELAKRARIRGYSKLNKGQLCKTLAYFYAPEFLS